MTGFHLTGTAVSTLPESRFPFYRIPGFRGPEYSLNGVIFGIRTSENDKKRILEALLEKKDRFHELKFYQAEYDAEKQIITSREKIGWVL